MHSAEVECTLKPLPEKLGNLGNLVTNYMSPLSKVHIQSLKPASSGKAKVCTYIIENISETENIK